MTTEEARPEPLLIGSMRRAKPDAQVRIVNGSGTTVRGFLAEFDEYVAERVEQAKAEALAPVLALANAPYGSEQWGHLRDGVRYIAAAYLHRALDSCFRPGDDA